MYPYSQQGKRIKISTRMTRIKRIFTEIISFHKNKFIIIDYKTLIARMNTDLFCFAE